jgi:hypothetical protein
MSTCSGVSHLRRESRETNGRAREREEERKIESASKTTTDSLTICFVAEGVLVARKDFNLPKHNEIDTRNLYVRQFAQICFISVSRLSADSFYPLSTPSFFQELSKRKALETHQTKIRD